MRRIGKDSIQHPDFIFIEHDECPYFHEESELSEVGSPVTKYIRADLCHCHSATRCDELKTVGCVSSIYINDPEHGYDEIFKRVSPSEDLIPLVTRQNAEEVIAAKDARIAELEEYFAEMTRSCLAERDRIKILEADNKRLREALKNLVERFSYYADLARDGVPNIEDWVYTEGSSDIAKARAVLGEVKP